MKKIVLIIWILISGLIGTSSYAYQTQGFWSRKENSNSIEFSCTNQCAIALGEKWDNNIFWLSQVEWNWTMTIGVNNNGQVIPLNNSEFKKWWAKLYITSYNGQPIPKQAQLIMILQGNISSTKASLEIMQSNWVDTIRFWWKEFWNIEPQTFYSINLRYGQKRLWTNWYGFLYLIGIIILLILYWNKKLTTQTLWLTCITLIIIVFFRNMIDYSHITIWSLDNYYSKWVYGNLWDYYTFTKKVTTLIVEPIIKNKNSCKIYLSCGQERPFCAHLKTVFIKPCTIVDSIWDSDYQLYYKNTPLGIQNTLYNQDWSSISKTKQ